MEKEKKKIFIIKNKRSFFYNIFKLYKKSGIKKNFKF